MTEELTPVLGPPADDSTVLVCVDKSPRASKLVLVQVVVKGIVPGGNDTVHVAATGDVDVTLAEPTAGSSSSLRTT